MLKGVGSSRFALVRTVCLFVVIPAATPAWASECESTIVEEICERAEGAALHVRRESPAMDMGWSGHEQLPLDGGPRSNAPAGAGRPEACVALPVLEVQPDLTGTARFIGKPIVKPPNQILCPARLSLSAGGRRLLDEVFQLPCDLWSERGRSFHVRAYRAPRSGQVALVIGVPIFVDEAWCGQSEVRVLSPRSSRLLARWTAAPPDTSYERLSLIVPFEKTKANLAQLYGTLARKACASGDEGQASWLFMRAEDLGAPAETCPARGDAGTPQAQQP